MSPRKPNQLPDDLVTELQAASKTLDDAYAGMKATVRKALKKGSVRQVALVLGISPTTVQKWSTER